VLVVNLKLSSYHSSSKTKRRKNRKTKERKSGVVPIFSIICVLGLHNNIT
jgi:hypothetical protein